MPIITLTSDFGDKDHSVGAVKGVLYSELQNITIVDISHKVSPFNSLEAAYIIENVYKNFPDKTIHIIGVDSELTSQKKHLAIELDSHYFICADNGILSLLTSRIKPTKIVELNLPNAIVSSFPTRDVFTKVAAHIARGGTLDVIGKPIKNLKPISFSAPNLNESKNQIIGHIIYIDNYGNVVTNITKTYLENLRKGRDLTIAVRNHSFKTIRSLYSDIISSDDDHEKDEGRGLALYNSSNYLEIAIYKSNHETIGGASTLMGLRLRDSVTVTFV